MKPTLLRTLERIVIVVTAASALILAASRLGVLPADYAEWALPIVFLGIVLEAVWRVLGQGLRRDSAVKSLIEADLEHAASEMGKLVQTQVRSCLMRPRGKCRRILSVAFSSKNMFADRDRGIRLEKWQGCAGKSWGHNKPVTADLTLPRQEGGPDWSMTADLIELTADIKAVLSYPVPIPERGSTLYGILNFDARVGAAEKFASPEGLNLADRHARAISAIIQAVT